MAIYGSLGEVNLTSLSASISDTAVDIFVYDTSKDSDGGAWRKRTQHTSWYNETLNTATRGSRREFPAVAVIVAKSNQVTIYDGDDPDLPMWMVFNQVNILSSWTGGGYLWLNVNTVNSSVSALNGIITIGTKDAPDNNVCGVLRIMFLTEVGIINSPWNGNTRYTTLPISGRNTSQLYIQRNEGTAIVNSQVNDVAMTVLPNTPIDPSTGLPIPTIAVATDGGVSVIRDDGTVVDWTESTGPDSTHRVSFRNDGKLGVFTSGTSGINNYPQAYYITIPSTDVSASFYYNFNSLGIEKYGYENETNSSARLAMKGNLNAQLVDLVDSSDRTYAATNAALNIISRPESVGTTADMTTGMIDFVTSSYNTGWMHGDIKGAFLSDTDATNVTGSEKISNYDFAADFSTQWESKNNATTSYDATNDRVTVTSVQNYSGIRLKSGSLPTLTQGKRYIMTVDVYSITNPIRFGVVSGNTKDNVSSAGVYTLVFTAGASITEVFVEKPTGSNSTFVLNSVSIREAEEDRSVNNKGLQVFGTVTKSAVATGAELVAYSGYSSSNYLVQPSITAPGTGDFSISAWIKPGSANGTGGNYFQLFSLGTSSTGGQSSSTGFVLKFAAHSGATSNGFSPYLYNNDGGSTHGTYDTNNYLPLGVWGQIVAVRKGGVPYIYLNGKLVKTGNSWTTNLTDTYLTVFLGLSHTNENGGEADVSLLRYSTSAPSSEQIKKIYEDEKVLFQENAACTLYGSSDAVTALAYDEVTQSLHVGTSSGRSDFQGLRRINNTTMAVTTVISAHDEFIVEQ